jgi:hypothetical protein
MEIYDHSAICPPVVVLNNEQGFVVKFMIKNTKHIYVFVSLKV